MFGDRGRIYRADGGSIHRGNSVFESACTEECGNQTCAGKTKQVMLIRLARLRGCVGWFRVNPRDDAKAEKMVISPNRSIR